MYHDENGVDDQLGVEAERRVGQEGPAPCGRV